MVREKQRRCCSWILTLTVLLGLVVPVEPARLYDRLLGLVARVEHRELGFVELLRSDGRSWTL